MTRELSATYRPPWVGEHFTGRYEPRTVDAEGKPEEQRFEVTCSICQIAFRGTCESGMPQQRIAKLAVGHVHKLPFASFR